MKMFKIFKVKFLAIGAIESISVYLKLKKFAIVELKVLTCDVLENGFKILKSFKV